MNNNLIDSLYHSGNNFRLKKALEKEQIKLAFIGGSVTKGWDGKGYISENYTCHIKKYFSDLYPDKRFESYNLSTESANSFIGLSITGKVIDDILPDIVFIEYAVNNKLPNITEHNTAYKVRHKKHCSEKRCSLYGSC